MVGHDWGALIAWSTALLRPDLVRGVVGLSVPYLPRGPVSLLTALRRAVGERYYMSYFQRPGVAEVELERDVRATLRRWFYSSSGDLPFAERGLLVAPEGGGILDVMHEPDMLPGWLTSADLDFYTAEFRRTGFAARRLGCQAAATGLSRSERPNSQ